MDDQLQPGTPSPAAGPAPSRSNAGRLLFGLLGLAVVVIVALWLAGVFSPPKKAAPPKTPTVVVQITKKGFVPAETLIPVGGTVQWVNRDSQPHRVQSNPYPSGSSLPGLDSKQPLGPGASYQYTFARAGNYGYHDYYQPTMNGKVTVGSSRP